MTVYFVGAGIGGVEYLTIKAYNIIKEADVIIYDALVATEILDIASNDCLKICVGKRGGKISTPQSNINELLIKYGQKFSRVIRLKCGDVGIFGRINEELTALSHFKINIELIPGISSALAVPLLAKIMLTEKDHSRCLTIITGHDPNILNWSILAQIDTLVILMGGKNLGIIIENLQKYGRSKDHPIAIIKDGGTFSQQMWTGTLEDIISKTANQSLSPCIIIIGKIVNHHLF